MSKLLYVQCSPRERSHSTAVANEFLDVYRRKNPDHEVRLFNVFRENLPPFDGHTVQAKYNVIHGLEHSAEDRESWRIVEQCIEDFKSYDKYLFSVPMWNWNIPYRLKQYLDILLQPGYAFKYGEQGKLIGLMKGKGYIIYARGNSYPPGTPREALNYQAPYLEFILRDIMDIQIAGAVAVEGTLGDPDKKEENKKIAIEEARRAAESF